MDVVVTTGVGYVQMDAVLVELFWVGQSLSRRD
jgi:hypothetical protein